MHLKASSAVIVPSTSFTVKACHSRKKENALSFDQVEQMLFNFMKQKQTWKSNYSTVRLFFLVWSSLNFPSVFLCINYWLCDLTGGLIFGALSILLSPSICKFVFLFSIKVLTKLLQNYAACQGHLFNWSAPYSGGSRPSDKGGWGHPHPEIFRPVWSKKKRGGPGPPGTSPRSTTAIERGVFAIAMIYHVGNYCAKNFRSDLTDLYGCLLPKKDVFTHNSLD